MIYWGILFSEGDSPDEEGAQRGTRARTRVSTEGLGLSRWGLAPALPWLRRSFLPGGPFLAARCWTALSILSGPHSKTPTEIQQPGQEAQEPPGVSHGALDLDWEEGALELTFLSDE